MQLATQHNTITPPVIIKSLAVRGSTSSDMDPPGSPAIAAALISVSVTILAVTLLILHKFWPSRSKGRNKAKPSLNEFEMLTGNLPDSAPNSLGLSSVMLTGPSMKTTANNASSDNVENRKFSVIDIPPEATLRLGLARHSALPLLNAASTLSGARFVQIERSSNHHPPFAHRRAMTVDSFVPSTSGIVEKPLPRRPSLAGSPHPLRAPQLPQMLTQPGLFSPGALSPTGSSFSHSRSESGASLFGFTQNGTSGIRAENEDTSIPSSISIPAAVAVGDVIYSSGGQLVAGNKLNDDDQTGAAHIYNTESVNPLNHSGQDASQTPPPWFERIANTSQAHQQTVDIPARMPHHRRAITVPEPLQTTRRYSYHPLSRAHSRATTLATPPPPPYTPLDINFEVPPLPQKARLHSSRCLDLATTSPLDGSTSGHPPRQQTPRRTPCTNDSKVSLRSQFNQQQAGANDRGAILFTHRRFNSVPIPNTPTPRGPRGQLRVETLRPLRINTGTGVTSPLWLPGTIEEITSTLPRRGTFTIDD